MLEYGISQGYDINFCSPITEAPLFSVVLSDGGDSDAVRLLLRHGACPGIPGFDTPSRDDAKIEAFIQRVENNSTAVLRQLLKPHEANINKRYYGGIYTPFFYAVHSGNEKLIALLLTVPNVDVEVSDQYGCTPLIAASRDGQEPCVLILLSLFLSGCTCQWAKDMCSPGLRRHKVNVNAQDLRGRTALMHAIINDKLSMILELLRYSFVVHDATLFDDNGDTALTIKSKTGRTMAEILNSLFRDAEGEVRQLIENLETPGRLSGEIRDKFFKYGQEEAGTCTLHAYHCRHDRRHLCNVGDSETGSTALMEDGSAERWSGIAVHRPEF